MNIYYTRVLINFTKVQGCEVSLALDSFLKGKGKGNAQGQCKLRVKDPICRRPRPISVSVSSEPILADLRLAKGCVLVSDMVMYFKMWACSNRTRMCDAPESIIIVML
jgi:hypothetical protein